MSALPLRKHDWEVELLSAARLPLSGTRNLPADQPTVDDFPNADAAYTRCESITREHSRTFYMASALLPQEKCRAARALYAFCRTTDDIVDHPHASVETRRAALENWQQTVQTGVTSPIAAAWRQTQAQFNIPQVYSQQFISGCARDLLQTRYDSFSDLAAYAYGVASTVGLMAMHIVGFKNEDAIPYAVRLGVALQLTNILRDVYTDWQNGRLYLPRQEMTAFGITEADLSLRRVTPAWRAFMAFQIERNRRLYNEALPGIALLDADGRMAICASARLYSAILDDIERHDYDVFSRRAHVGTWGKLSRLPGIWWYSRTVKLHSHKTLAL